MATQNGGKGDGDMLTVDQICAAHKDESAGLTVRMIDENDEDREFPIVLIQGSARALEFLAQLILSTARDKANDGFSITPFGAGKFHFSPSATLGVYIHRLDD